MDDPRWAVCDEIHWQETRDLAPSILQADCLVRYSAFYYSAFCYLHHSEFTRSKLNTNFDLHLLMGIQHEFSEPQNICIYCAKKNSLTAYIGACWITSVGIGVSEDVILRMATRLTADCSSKV